jgi:hypothetical protein
MRSLIVACFIGLLLGSNLHAAVEEICIYYDPAKGNAWINPAQMAPAAEAALTDKRIPCSIMDTDTMVSYMNANAEGIVIMTSGIAPGEIFKSQGDKDLVHKWLFAGGIMFWTGDWPFYYWDVPANCPGAAGEASVFGVTVTQGADNTLVKPTDLGAELIPSIKQHLSCRPVSIAILEANDFAYESYADNGDLADPIAFQAEDMKGWFVNTYTWPDDESLDDIGVLISELLENRFFIDLPVDTKDKLARTWGEIKRASD